MTKFELSLKSFRRTLRSQRTVALLLIAMVAVTAGVSWMLRSSAASSGASLTQGLGAREIEVVNGLMGPQSRPLTKSSVQELAALPHVQSVYALGAMGVDPPAALVDSGRTEGPWWLTPQNADDDRLRDSSGNPARSLRPGEILVPPRYADLLGRDISIGVTVMLTPESATSQMRTFHVAGTYDPDSVQGEQLDAVYVHADEFSTIQEKGTPPGVAPYTSAYVYVDDIVHVAEIQSRIEEMGFGSRSAQGAGIGLKEARESLTLLAGSLIFAMAMSSLFAGIFISSGWMASRREEIGLFRSLGWSRSAIGGIYTRESIAFALFSACMGVAAGALSAIAMNIAGSRFTFLSRLTTPFDALWAHAWTLLVPLAIVPLGFLTGCLRGLWEIKSIDTDSLLREID